MNEEKDLILGGEEDGEAEDLFYDEPCLHSEISSAYNAICSIDGLDTSLMDEKRKKRVGRIKDMAIDIIYKNICSIHKEVMGREE